MCYNFRQLKATNASRPSRHSSRERGRTVQARGETPWPVGEEIDGRGMVPIPNLPSSMCLGTGSYCIEVPAASGAAFHAQQNQ